MQIIQSLSFNISLTLFQDLSEPAESWFWPSYVLKGAEEDAEEDEDEEKDEEDIEFEVCIFLQLKHQT